MCLKKTKVFNDKAEAFDLKILNVEDSLFRLEASKRLLEKFAHERHAKTAS